MGSFLCDEDMIDDRKIQKLINEFGESAGFVFVRLLAHVKKAQECCHIVFTSSQWFRKFEAEGVTNLEIIKKIFSKLAELELIDPFLYKNEGIIFLPKYIKRHANYFKQLQRRDSYSGKNLRDRLRSGFDDREEKDSFSISFKDFILLIEQEYLKQGIELGINTDNQEIVYAQKNVRLRRDEETRICTSINNELIYNDHINNNYIIYNAKNKNFEKEEIEKKQETKNAKNFYLNEQIDIKNIKPQTTTLQNSEPVEVSGVVLSDISNQIGVLLLPSEKDKWKNKIATMMYKNVKRLDPNYPKPSLQKWAKIFDLPEIKERERGEIEKVLFYSQQHKYWYKKILTPYDLVNNFTKIMLDMIDPKTNNETRYAYSKIAPDSERNSPTHRGEPVVIGDLIKQKFSSLGIIKN